MIREGATGSCDMREVGSGGIRKPATKFREQRTARQEA